LVALRFKIRDAGYANGISGASHDGSAIMQCKRFLILEEICTPT